MTLIIFTAIECPAKVADDTGAMILQACANASRMTIYVAKGSKYHRGAVYRPEEASRLSGALSIEERLAMLREQDSDAREFLQACYDRRNIDPAAPAAPAYDTRSPWNTLPGHDPQDWKYEVANGDTRLGYLEWADAREEMAEEDDDPVSCECDNTHEQNDTVCRWCWEKGRRKPSDPEVEAEA